MNTDVTDVVQRYRLALRNIWNSSFWVDPDLRDWDSVYAFRELKLPLFRALVAYPLDLEPNGTIFGKRFRVMPQENQDAFGTIQVNTWAPSCPDAGIWEPLKGTVRANDVSLVLIDHFDWTPMGYIDLRYYVVLIESFGSHPDKVGQHALVEVISTRVFLAAGGEREDELTIPG